MTVLLDERPKVHEQREHLKLRKPGNRNLAEIRRQIEWARADVETGKSRDKIHWDQCSWISVDKPNLLPFNCRTSACIAGHTVISNGAQYARVRGNGQVIDVYYGDRMYIVRDLAKLMLGLNEYDAELLFHANNDIDDLEAILHEWEQEEIDTR